MRVTSKSPARENRFLPGWARVVLMVWGIAVLLLLLQQGSLAVFGLFLE